MPRAILLALVVAVTLLLWLIWRQNPLWPRERARVDHWLECEECQGTELGSVLSLGTRALPTLGRSLKTGPDVHRVQLVRDHLQSSYHSLVGYQNAHGLAPIGISQSQYVDRFLGNYDATYRVRSAIAIARIGGVQAKDLLIQGSALPNLRPDVRARIVFQRDSVWHP